MNETFVVVFLILLTVLYMIVKDNRSSGKK